MKDISLLFQTELNISNDQGLSATTAVSVTEIYTLLYVHMYISYVSNNDENSSPAKMSYLQHGVTKLLNFQIFLYTLSI